MQDRNKAVVRRLIEDFLVTGDPDVADEILAPDYVDHTPSDSGLSGRENFKRFTGEWLSAFPDTRNVVQDLVAENDRVAVRWTINATHEESFRSVAPTGDRVEVEAIGIFRVADGKIVESWDKYDTPGLWS
ncbi:MAG: ester cyclase [Rubrobacteraceae bacterium]